MKIVIEAFGVTMGRTIKYIKNQGRFDLVSDNVTSANTNGIIDGTERKHQVEHVFIVVAAFAIGYNDVVDIFVGIVVGCSFCSIIRHAK